MRRFGDEDEGSDDFFVEVVEQSEEIFSVLFSAKKRRELFDEILFVVRRFYFSEIGAQHIEKAAVGEHRERGLP